jgi:hypothetical protein
MGRVEGIISIFWLWGGFWVTVGLFVGRIDQSIIREIMNWFIALLNGLSVHLSGFFLLFNNITIIVVFLFRRI